MKLLKLFFVFLLHLFMVILLTAVTQIGGIIYLGVLICVRKKQKRYQLKRFGLFAVLYGFTTLLILPFVAPFFGREKIEHTEIITPRSYFYVIANRNYVTPTMNQTLQSISKRFAKEYPNIEIQYLDANFPFIDKFPLLPHRSHNDGKKLDISFVYKNSNGLSNKKPSVSGYGVYEDPLASEVNQTEICLSRGNWQYDFPKYLTLGIINPDLKFSEEANRRLISLITSEEKIGKVFIEPHLKHRLRLTSTKIRFHGCKAVRHDDHIHLQLR